MPYRLTENETPAAGMKRLAEEQLDRALAALTSADAEADAVDEAVHDARKRFKKIRAALRLVRDEVGSQVYSSTNDTFRNAGRRLSPLRDSQVLIETLDDLRARYADILDEQAFETIRRNLQKRHDAVFAQLIEEEQAVDAVVETLDAARASIQTWPIDAEGFDAFYGGLKRVYKRGRNAMHVARSDPSTENLHEWRKRVKYLWYHLRILKRTWPDLLDEWADTTHDLANLLGDDHDLAVLHATLQDEPTLHEDERAYRALLGLIEQHRRQLQAQAWPLGQRLYTESPSDFTDRVAAYWQAEPL